MFNLITKGNIMATVGKLLKKYLMQISHEEHLAQSTYMHHKIISFHRNWATNLCFSGKWGNWVDLPTEIHSSSKCVWKLSSFTL